MGRAGVPMNPAAYDGFAAERERVYAALGAEGANAVVLAGDSHNAWCHDIIDEAGRR